MSCKLRKGLTQPIDKTSVEVKEGEPSLLWGRLWDVFTDENGNTNVIEAYKAYLITTQEDFKQWFKSAKKSRSNINKQGEPRVFVNSETGIAHYRSVNPITNYTTYWNILDDTMESALMYDPIGLEKITGISALQMKELSDMYLRALLKGGYEVVDFNDLDKINATPVLDLAYYMADEYEEDYKKEVGEYPPASIRTMHRRVLEDLVATDNEGNYLVNENDELLLNPKSVLYRIISRRVGVGDSVKISNKEDNAEKTSALNIGPAYLQNPKAKATHNIKLMIQTLDEVTRDAEGNIQKVFNSFGQEKLVNAAKVYNRLLDYLSDSQVTDLQPDVYQVMLEKLNSLSRFHPEFTELIERLERSDEYKQTQFVRAFNRPKINYSSTFIDKDSRTKVDIGSPDVQSSAASVQAQWKDNFERIVLKLNNKQQKVVNKPAVEKAVKQYNELLSDISRAVAKRERSAGQIEINLNPLIKKFQSVLSTIGIDMSTDSLNLLIYDTEQEDRAARFSSIVNEFKYVFKESKAKDARSLGNLQEDTVLEDEVGDVLSVIEDEKTIKALAAAEARFQSDLVDSTVLGPAGKKYWNYGLHSSLSNMVQSIQQGNLEYINKLASQEYTQGSKWVEFILKDDNYKKFSYEQMLHMKNTAEATDGLPFRSIVGIDELINNIHRILKGKFTTIAKGTSQTEYYITGPEVVFPEVEYSNNEFIIKGNEIVNNLVQYIRNDFAIKERAWQDVFGENALPTQKLITNFHYKGTNPDGSPRLRDENGYPTGNVFNSESMFFPSLGYNTEISKELSLYHTEGVMKGKPVADVQSILYKKSPHYKVQDLIETAFTNRFQEILQNAVDNGIVFVNQEGKIANLRLESATISGIKTEDSSQKTATALAAYILNSMISAREAIGMFVGHPAMYKSMDDMPKRTAHFTTPVEKLRIYKTNGEWQVNPNYVHKTVPEIEIDSTTINDPSFVRAVGKEIANLYKTVNVTDATTWISPELYRQREKGLGTWSELKNEAFERIITNKATAEDYQTIFFTPRKGTVRGTNVKSGYNVPDIEKTAYVVLWPALVNTTKMQEVYNGMLAVEKRPEYKGMGSQIAVDSAIKAGQVAGVEIRNHSTWGLAQDLPNKGFGPTIVGSQSKVLVTSIVDPEISYGGMTGAEWLAAANQVEVDISDLGLQEFISKWGLDPEGIETFADHKNGTGRRRFFQQLINEFKKDENDNVVQKLRYAMNKNLPLDSIFEARNRFESLITNGLTSKAVLYKSLGGQFVQVSSYNLGYNMEAYENVKNNLTGRIRWFEKEPRLKPSRIVNGKVVPGQILLPYRFVEAIPGFENMTDDELLAAIDPKALEVLGYRIPGQSLASIDNLKIIGILPPESGDQVIVYEDITTKTGSDYDIDKLFLLLPNLEIENGKLRRVSSDGKTKKALENKRLELWEGLLNAEVAFRDKMFPIDTAFLKDDAYAIRKLQAAEQIEEGTVDAKGKNILQDLQFVSPLFQSELRGRFMVGQKMVASVANNTIDHVLSMHAGLGLMKDIGIGNIVEVGKSRYTDLSQKMTADKLLQIIQVLSAYMNANVDIEKDPYISFTNFNMNTGNVGFLLLRAGVSYKWVNRFLAQPILIELSKQMDALRSESSPVKYKYKTAVENAKKAIREKLVDRLDIEDLESGDIVYTLGANKYTFVGKSTRDNESDKIIVINKDGKEMNLSTKTALYAQELLPGEVLEGRLEDVLTIENMEDFIANGINADEFFKYQNYILEEFSTLKKSGDQVFAQLMASKAGTDGGGRNLTEANLIYEKYKRIFDDTNTFLNFKKKFDGTALQAYHNNTVEFLLDRFDDMFLSQSSFMRDGLSVLLSGIGATNTTLGSDIYFRQRLINKMFAYVYSGHTGRLLQNQHYQNLFFSTPTNKSLSQEFRDLKSKMPADPLLSLLTSTLNYNEKDNLIKPSIIKARGTKSLSPEAKAAAQERWGQMLLDPATRQFANKLAVMAFHVSGFSQSLNSFHELIPTQWWLASEFASEMKKQMEYVQTNGSLNIPQMVDQVIRHEFDNTNFVEDFSKAQGVKRVQYQDKDTNKGITFESDLAFVLTGKGKKKAMTLNQNRKGKKDYLKFIKIGEQEKDIKYSGIDRKTGEVKFKTLKVTDFKYYKYVGSKVTQKSPGQFELNPVYVRTTPLGYKGPKGVVINEYEFNDESTSMIYGKKSNFPENRIEEPNSFIKKQLAKMINSLADPVSIDYLAEHSNPNQFRCK